MKTFKPLIFGCCVGGLALYAASPREVELRVGITFQVNGTPATVVKIQSLP